MSEVLSVASGSAARAHGHRARARRDRQALRSGVAGGRGIALAAWACMRALNDLRLAASMLLVAVNALACSGGASEDRTESSSSTLSVRPIGTIGLPPIVVGPSQPPSPPPPPVLYIGDEHGTATVLADADLWFSTYFPGTDDEEADGVASGFTDLGTPDYWRIGRRGAALVQMYDLVAPLDATRAAVYLERLRRIASALLDKRDDHRTIGPDAGVPSLSATGQPIDGFRHQVMPAWGAITANRDGKWNNDVVTSGLFVHAMAAFARRVAENPTLQSRVGGTGFGAYSFAGPRGTKAAHTMLPAVTGGLVTYADDAIRFTTAALETYRAFRPEVHLREDDPEAWFRMPLAYGTLACVTDNGCVVYRDTAGAPAAYNENLSMIKALAEVALASDSALYRGSRATNDALLELGRFEVPLLVAKNVRFFVDNLQPRTLWDGTPYFRWNHQKPTARIQDTAHASFELGSLAAVLENKPSLDALLARNGRSEQVPIGAPELQRLANTLLRLVVKDGSDYGYRYLLDVRIDGAKDYDALNNANGDCAGWTPLAQVSPAAWRLCRDAMYEASRFIREDNTAALLRYRQFL